MTNRAAITKIERVTESIESLVVAAVEHRLNPSNPRACYDHVADARKEVAAALTDFLIPTLRVVADERHYNVGGADGVSKTFTHVTMETVPVADASGLSHLLIS